MLVIKAGGSAITYKSRPYTANKKAMHNLASQLAGLNEPVILIHGVGSYGHPPAKQYRIDLGADGTPERTYGLAVTHFRAGELAQKLIGVLIDAGLKALYCRASSLFVTRQRRIAAFYREPVERYLDLGLIPVLHGDGPVDRGQGFCVLSGDQIAVDLARRFRARKVIFCMDVPGILREGRVIDHLRFGQIDDLYRHIADNHDASGGLMAKLLEIRTLQPAGIPAQLVTLQNDTDLVAAARNQTIGTLID
ncbi:MAG TPA: isopentenyl phosphate kinase [bacterium]|nr:isopentenyl phosphate kinase [bacterium]